MGKISKMPLVIFSFFLLVIFLKIRLVMVSILRIERCCIAMVLCMGSSMIGLETSLWLLWGGEVGFNLTYYERRECQR